MSWAKEAKAILAIVADDPGHPEQAEARKLLDGYWGHKGTYIIKVVDSNDAVRCYGPFESRAEAVAFAERRRGVRTPPRILEGSYIITYLVPPK